MSDLTKADGRRGRANLRINQALDKTVAEYEAEITRLTGLAPRRRGPIQAARARVVEAVKAWVNINTSNDDDGPVALAAEVELYAAVAELERLEAEVKA